MSGPQSTPTRIRDTERRALALQLRREGLSYEDIAAYTGPDGHRLYATRQGANRAVLRELRNMGAEDVESLRTMELARLDELHRRLWPDTEPGPVMCDECRVAVRCPACDAKVNRVVNLGAVHAVVRTMERRASLVGLDYSDQTSRRAVELLESQVGIVERALDTAVSRTGLDPDVATTLFNNLAAAFREIEREDPDPTRPRRLVAAE